MIFDGFFISKLVVELNLALHKSRLERIYQIEEQVFVFVFYGMGKRRHLKIHLSAQNFGIFLTRKDDRTHVGSQFFNSLKKHLEGAILNEITQHETDRVILLSFTHYDFISGPVEKKLVFEAMGRHSNLILIQDQIIIDTYKKMFFETGRQLLPQAEFSFFPSDKSPFHQMTYDKVFEPKDLVERYLGISPVLASYLFSHQLLPCDLFIKPTRDLTLKKDYVADIFASDHQKKYYETISEMMDDSQSEEKPKYVSIHHFLKKQIEKYQKKIEQTEMLIEQNQEKLEDKTKADRIYQSTIDLKTHHSSIEIDGITLFLDVTKTLNDNAQQFYKSYQKAKKGILHLKQMMIDYQELLSHFESLMDFVLISSSDSILDLESELLHYGYKKVKTLQHKKKTDKKPKIMKIEEEDAIYWVGKNNLQNAYLTHELALKDDYWFHVKDATGGHIIVRTPHLNDKIIRKAASLAAYYSSLRASSSIPVDYTLVRHIKKIPQVPGYKVTYKNHQTKYIDIDLDAMKQNDH
jgi:predicted ribosome quality control (RQC) complex YloA/Tae2 family protein